MTRRTGDADADRPGVVMGIDRVHKFEEHDGGVKKSGSTNGDNDRLRSEMNNTWPLLFCLFPFLKVRGI